MARAAAVSSLPVWVVACRAGRTAVCFPVLTSTPLSVLFAAPAKPIFKWAGGKGKLLLEITRRLPDALRQGRITAYVEPFIGGGALFFHLAEQHDFERLLIGDLNEDLFLAYNVVREDVDTLLAHLAALQAHYNALPAEGQAAFYYETRTAFNAARAGWCYQCYAATWVQRAAQFFVLNRLCFNGLYRVNSRAEFNVPFGKYAAVNFGSAEALRAAARVLQRTVVQCGDFATAAAFADDRTLVYLDPPYRPITPTSSFTTYARQAFGDAEQVRLATFFRQLTQQGSAVMLSNSDPLTATGDDFFEQLYAGFTISRLQAARAINANGAGRGAVSELLITNY